MTEVSHKKFLDILKKKKKKAVGGFQFNKHAGGYEQKCTWLTYRMMKEFLEICQPVVSLDHQTLVRDQWLPVKGTL